MRIQLVLHLFYIVICMMIWCWCPSFFGPNPSDTKGPIILHMAHNKMLSGRCCQTCAPTLACPKQMRRPRYRHAMYAVMRLASAWALCGHVRPVCAHCRDGCGPARIKFNTLSRIRRPMRLGKRLGVQSLSTLPLQHDVGFNHMQTQVLTICCQNLCVQG